MSNRARPARGADDLTATRAVDLISARAGAALSLEPDGDVVAPGETTVVNVYLSGSGQLRGYEFAVRVSGGESGELTVESVDIDMSRPDHVFAGRQVLDAADSVGLRALAALMDDAVRFRSRVYLGTVRLRASDDAHGAFVVKLDTERSSFWVDTHVALPLRPTLEVTITVP